MTKKQEAERLARSLMEELANEGRIIEGGWLALRALAIPPDAPKTQLDAMRLAFYGGAQHLFSCMLNMMSADAEPTEEDVRRMHLIERELKAWSEKISKGLG